MVAQSSRPALIPEDNGDEDDTGAALLQHSQQVDLLRNFKPLECARDRAKTKKKAAVDDDDMDWLRTSASEHFGRGPPAVSTHSSSGSAKCRHRCAVVVCCTVL